MSWPGYTSTKAVGTVLEENVRVSLGAIWPHSVTQAWVLSQNDPKVAGRVAGSKSGPTHPFVAVGTEEAGVVAFLDHDVGDAGLVLLL